MKLLNIALCIRTCTCAYSYPFLVQALDKMEAEWEPVLMEIVQYKETGTYIMKSGEETAQMLDDHIVMAQAMSFSPYKKPFELRIATWENKLRLTQVCMNSKAGHPGVPCYNMFVCLSGLWLGRLLHLSFHFLKKPVCYAHVFP